jgi:CBS domain-containing protein
VAIPLGRALPLDASPEEALTLMSAEGLEHLPIAIGGLIVGIVSREAVAALVAGNPGVDAALAPPPEVKATTGRVAALAPNPLAA